VRRCDGLLSGVEELLMWRWTGVVVDERRSADAAKYGRQNRGIWRMGQGWELKGGCELDEQ